eukprot:5687703-Pleurochrysis_carterae.AAC.5
MRGALLAILVKAHAGRTGSLPLKNRLTRATCYHCYFCASLSMQNDFTMHTKASNACTPTRE